MSHEPDNISDCITFDGDDSMDTARYGLKGYCAPRVKPYDVRVRVRMRERLDEQRRKNPNMDMTSLHIVYQMAEYEARKKLQPIFRRSRYAKWTRH
jgi:hypothetical protein